MDVDEAPPLIDTTIPNTATALEVADLVIEILDARDPLSYRSEFLEKKVNKPLLFVLNKTGGVLSLWPTFFSLMLSRSCASGVSLGLDYNSKTTISHIDISIIFVKFTGASPGSARKI
jgi:hypothetical protein